MTTPRIWTLRGAIGGVFLSLLVGSIDLAVRGEPWHLDSVIGYAAGSICGGLLGGVIGRRIGEAIARKRAN